MKTTHPLRGLRDPRWRYVPACATDIRRTFRRARLLMRLIQRNDVANIKDSLTVQTR
jgi:hypothetical protein